MPDRFVSVVDEGCAATCRIPPLCVPYPMVTIMRVKHSRVQGGGAGGGAGAELHTLRSIACEQSASLGVDLPLRRAPLSCWARRRLCRQPPETLWGGLWLCRGLQCWWGASAWTEAMQSAMPCTPAQSRNQKKGQTAADRQRSEKGKLLAAETCRACQPQPQPRLCMSECTDRPTVDPQHVHAVAVLAWLCKASGAVKACLTQASLLPLAFCAQQLESLSLAFKRCLAGLLQQALQGRPCPSMLLCSGVCLFWPDLAQQHVQLKAPTCCCRGITWTSLKVTLMLPLR